MNRPPPARNRRRGDSADDRYFLRTSAVTCQVASAKRGSGSLRAAATRQSCSPPDCAPSTESASTLPSPVSVSCDRRAIGGDAGAPALIDGARQLGRVGTRRRLGQRLGELLLHVGIERARPACRPPRPPSAPRPPWAAAACRRAPRGRRGRAAATAAPATTAAASPPSPANRRRRARRSAGGSDPSTVASVRRRPRRATAAA